MRSSLPTILLSLMLLQAPLASEAATVSRQSDDPVTAECQRIGSKLGSVSIKGCMASRLHDSGGRSVKGQAILLKEYPPLSGRDPIGRVLLIGGTHGDEYSSVSIVFKWMQTLDIHHSGMFHWHVTPLLNPDGLLLSHPSVRLNAHGVDLNRNMPTPNWEKLTGDYWQKTGHDPRRYPGSAPLSEPESRWLYEEIRTFKPHAIISVHAPYGVLDFDGPPVGPESVGHLHLKLIGTYPGSLGNCAGVQHEIPVITFELPYAGIMPNPQQMEAMWDDLIRWLRYNIPKEKTVAAYPHFDEITNRLMPPAEETPTVMTPDSATPAAIPASALPPLTDLNTPEVTVREEVID